MIWHLIFQLTTTNLVPVVTEVTNEYRWIGTLTIQGTNYQCLMPYTVTNIKILDVTIRSSQGPMSTNWCDMKLEETGLQHFIK